jgi:hypothetical protein
MSSFNRAKAENETASSCGIKGNRFRVSGYRSWEKIAVLMFYSLSCLTQIKVHAAGTGFL